MGIGSPRSWSSKFLKKSGNTLKPILNGSKFQGPRMSGAHIDKAPLQLLSVVIPARDEAGCIASTVEHLYVELRLHNVPHEIIVVDDGSTDETWTMLESAKTRVPTLRPVQNPAPHGFGRAVVRGFDHMTGDAVVIMMADESDDCRDVVR